MLRSQAPLPSFWIREANESPRNRCWPRLGAPRQEPESSLLLRLLPPPTQGSPLCPGDQRSPELFALEGGLFWPPK